MNLRLIYSRRKAPCPAKLRYAQEILRDLTRLLETLEDKRQAHLLQDLVTDAEREAARQLALLDPENERMPGDIAR